MLFQLNSRFSLPEKKKQKNRGVLVVMTIFIFLSVGIQFKPF